MTGDVGSGEEVAQNAFLAVADWYGRLDDPVPYLRRTIVNGARMAHRADGRRFAREQRAGAPASESEPLLDVDLLAALAQLHHDQRSAMVLRYWADWTDVEIADALGCRPSTVRSHLRRGITQLRARLQFDTEAS